MTACINFNSSCRTAVFRAGTVGGTIASATVVVIAQLN
jgi:hypothetical protein